MAETSDDILALQSAQGDQRAFIELVRRYERPLTALIAYHVSHPDDAQDVWQQTLIDVWMGLRRLRDPRKIRAWLFQVARNRCCDYHRSSQRREFALESRALEEHANRFGLARVRRQETVEDLLDACEEIPDAEREMIRLFYLEGLTIAEIARRHACPPGTIKRRLFHARGHLRQSLGIVPGGTPASTRRIPMNTATPGARSQPFPAARPSITLAPSPDPLTTVDCPELRQWFIVPRIGERARCALYNPPDWTLSAVTDLHAVAPARVHGVEGVEIRIDEWRPAGGWTPGEWALYGRLTPDKAEYLAVILAADGERLLQTFLDEGFSDAWGQMDRTLEDRGTFVPAGESAFRLAAQPGPLRAEGSGTSIVTVEDRSFRCLRAIQLEGPLSDPRAPVTVSYITAEGRTILIRHYCHEGSTEAPTDSASRLTIDGTEFVHWYDCLTDLGCGLPGGA